MEFTSLANRVSGLSADALLDCFLSGLKADIRREVIAQGPISLLKAVSLAKLFEEKYTTPQKPYTTSPGHKYQFPNTYSQNKSHYNQTNNFPTHTKSLLPPLLPTPQTKPINQSIPNPQCETNQSS